MIPLSRDGVMGELKRCVLEVMLNRGRDVFYTNLEKFLKCRDLEAAEFNPRELIKKSDDDNIFLKTSILDVDGFEEFIANNDMRVYKINPDITLLKPIDDNEESNFSGFFMFYFDSMFHNSELYHLAPSSSRETIRQNGLVPMYLEFGEVEPGFETHDPRIHLIVMDQVAVCDLYYRNIDQAIKTILEYINKRYPGSGPYDVWKVKLPENVELHRDASFECGAYIKSALPAEYLKLAIENVPL